MKLPLLLGGLFVTVLIPLHADDWLVNEDFSNGNDHWYGQAKWPTDFAPDDLSAKPDPLTAQGMIFPLRSSDWVKECQDFKGKTANAILKITYDVSPGLTFSQKGEDYSNVPDKIGWDAWKSFDAPVGSFIVFISELEERHGNYFLIQPDLTKTGDQVYEARVEGMTPWTQKTLALCLPPGNGTIVIKKLEIVDPDSH